MIVKKRTLIRLGGFFLLLTGLYIYSSPWFRLQLADYYLAKKKDLFCDGSSNVLKKDSTEAQKKYDERLLKLYEKIVRKSELETQAFLVFRQKVSNEKKYEMSKKLADYYFDKGEKAQASRYYAILKRLRPEKVEDFFKLFLLESDTDQFFDIAFNAPRINLNAELIQQYLSFPFWRYGLAVYWIDHGNYQNAKTILEELLLGYPYLSVAHYQLGRVYQLSSLYPEAIDEYEKAVHLWPGHFAALTKLLEIYMLQKEVDKADAIMNQITQVEGVNNKNDINSQPTFDIFAAWTFENDQDGIVNDYSGRSHSGKIYGATWVQEDKRKALRFTGNDYVQIPDHGDLTSAGGITVSFWMKIKSWSDSYSTHPIQKMKTINDTNFSFYLDGKYLKDKLVVLASCNGIWGGVSPASQPFELNNWYYIVWTYSEEGGRLYVNGVRQGDKIGGGHLGKAKGVAIVLGSSFSGLLDDVYIFNRVFSENEIRGIFNTYK